MQNAEKPRHLPLLGSQNTGSKAFTLQSREWKLSFRGSDQQKRKKPKDSDYWEFPNKWPTQINPP